MKIQEQMVKLLNEDSWDDVVRNYPDSSSTSTLKALIYTFIFIHLCTIFNLKLTHIFVYSIKR